MVSVFRSFTKSLVTSSAKIARTGFTFGRSFLPGTRSASPTSPSMDDEPGSVRAPTPPASEVSANGAWDPLDPDLAPDLRDEDPAELRFIRLSGKATLPTRAHDDDAGLDLYSAEGARIGPGQRVSVGTGLAVAIPEGLAGLVLPRSGLALKHGIALVNAPGLIDPGYRGEVRVLLLNTDRTSEFRVSPGDRIAQLLLVPIAHASPLEADSLESSARGPSGFGSSGLD
jgi:dUTP pyrophosphatase